MHKIGLLLTACLFLLASTSLAAPQEAVDRAAVDAYRAGDLATAAATWRELLEREEPLPAAERARLCYDLGNCALREERPLEAVGWFTASLRLRPRDADTWANLELARLEAGLPAADQGDLRATWNRLLSALTPAESSWLALLSLLPLAAALAFEALRGGRAARWLSLVGAGVALIGALPWLSQRIDPRFDPVIVIAEEAVALRAEPRPDAERLLDAQPGDVLERADALPRWTAVELDGERTGWLPREATFGLNR